MGQQVCLPIWTASCHKPSTPCSRRQHRSHTQHRVTRVGNSERRHDATPALQCSTCTCQASSYHTQQQQQHQPSPPPPPAHLGGHVVLRLTGTARHVQQLRHHARLLLAPPHHEQHSGHAAHLVVQERGAAHHQRVHLQGGEGVGAGLRGRDRGIL